MNSSDNRQYKEKVQEQYQQKQQVENRESRALKCGRCGAVYAEGDLFCPECGEPLGGRHCAYCGAELTPTCEICPKCGRPTDALHCSFCGAPLGDEESFCSECGSPRGGIVCPDCGTRSFRSFCPHCNRPLNDNALAAMEEARKDPKFQRVLALNQEMAEMEHYLLHFKEEIEKAMAEEEADAEAPDMPGLSAEGEQLQARYAELMKLLGQQSDRPATPAPATSQPRTAEKRKRELKLFLRPTIRVSLYDRTTGQRINGIPHFLPDIVHIYTAVLEKWTGQDEFPDTVNEI